MARNQKIVLTGQPHLVGIRTEQGLPFMPNKLINLIIEGNMAKAQTKFPVTICRYIWTPNHAHFILIPKDPNDFVDFIGYVKRETAHAINRLTGYRKRTIWTEGFDSPVILDFETCKKYCHYIDSNPLRDRQERTLARYPGVKSYKAKNSRFIRRIPRHKLKKLPPNPDYTKLARLYSSKAEGKYKLVIEPDAWMAAYRREGEAEKTNQWLASKLSELEESLKEVPVVGRGALQTAPLNRTYTPKKYSPRMICVSIYKKLRMEFIDTYRSLSFKAKKLWEEQRRLSEGFFAPGRLCGGCLTGKEIGL